MKKTTWIMMGCLLAVTACGGESESEYVASDAKKQCFDRGLKPGTEAYDTCVREETSASQIRQQRDEYDQMQREKDYYRSLHY